MEPQFQSQFDPAQAQPQSHRLRWVILIAIVILGWVAGFLFWAQANNSWPFRAAEEIVYCTQEAKMCPDGSYVSRTAPSCEFATCPAIENDTSDWKTYRNEEYGFEVKYPGELFVVEDKQTLLTVQSTPKTIQFGGLLPSDAGIEGVDWVSDGYQYYVVIMKKGSFDNSYPSSDPDIIRTVLTFPGIEATRYDLINQISRGPTVAINYPRDPNSLIIVGSASLCFDSTICTHEKVENIFDQILSTFKFIAYDSVGAGEPIDTSSWNTYRNEEYGFEIKYHPDNFVKFGFFGETTNTLMLGCCGDTPWGLIYTSDTPKQEVIDKIINRISSEKEGKLISRKQVNFAGEEATEIVSERIEEGCCGEYKATIVEIVFSHNGVTYHTEDHDDIHKDSFSTFKFIK